MRLDPSLPSVHRSELNRSQPCRSDAPGERHYSNRNLSRIGVSWRAGSDNPVSRLTEQQALWIADVLAMAGASGEFPTGIRSMHGLRRHLADVLGVHHDTVRSVHDASRGTGKYKHYWPHLFGDWKPPVRVMPWPHYVERRRRGTLGRRYRSSIDRENVLIRRRNRLANARFQQAMRERHARPAPQLDLLADQPPTTLHPQLPHWSDWPQGC